MYTDRVNPSHTEYVQRINRTMDYIDRHLHEPLPLETLAGVAAFSKYHFHRIFYAHVGETPGQYVQRLRVEKAAVLVAAHRDRSITDIAYSVGFRDVAAFSRAFRLAHGVSPSAYRTRRRNLSTTDRKNGTATHTGADYTAGMSTSPMKPMPASSVAIVDKPEMTVAYVRHTGPYFGDELLFQRLFSTLYTWAQPRDLIRRGETEEIVVYHDDPDSVAPEKLRISCGIFVPAETEVSGEIGKMTIPAGRYADARFEVDATQFGAAWQWVYGVWLPESGYQPDDRLCYERYLDSEPDATIDGTTGRRFVVDICVPITPL